MTETTTDKYCDFLKNKGLDKIKMPYSLFEATIEYIDSLEQNQVNITLGSVSKSFTPKQIVELLKEEEALDDAISFFTHLPDVC